MGCTAKNKRPYDSTSKVPIRLQAYDQVVVAHPLWSFVLALGKCESQFKLPTRVSFQDFFKSSLELFSHKIGSLSDCGLPQNIARFSGTMFKLTHHWVVKGTSLIYSCRDFSFGSRAFYCKKTCVNSLQKDVSDNFGVLTWPSLVLDSYFASLSLFCRFMDLTLFFWSSSWRDFLS